MGWIEILTLASPIIEFLIKLFWTNKSEREQKTIAWRKWLAARQEDAKRSADLRDAQKKQQERIDKDRSELIKKHKTERKNLKIQQKVLRKQKKDADGNESPVNDH